MKRTLMEGDRVEIGGDGVYEVQSTSMSWGRVTGFVSTPGGTLDLELNLVKVDEL